ncbi:MAG: multiprotein-bridging factor 1 family protein [Bdellovibrionales bacterium]
MKPQEIRTLRRRLGWSLAEMARRMGCGTDLITSWESGDQNPDAESLNQLHFLHFHVESSSAITAQTPMAERELEIRGIAQVTHRDLLKDN